jgi:hypothetical protein
MLGIALAMLLTTFTVSPAAAAPPSEAEMKASIEAFILAHPMDFVGIDALVYRYRGEHITVATVGVDRPMTAAEAAKVHAARASESVVVLGSIPTPQVYITSVKISGGVQFWGTWDFPNSWAGQGSPKDIAAQTFSTKTCTKMQNGRIWTYAVQSGSTNLGTVWSSEPNRSILWNVADYVTNFENQADRGTTRMEIVRTSSCSSAKINVGAAFDYEGNAGGGSIVSVSVNFGIFSVGYNSTPLHDHWGTYPIYVEI